MRQREQNYLDWKDIAAEAFVKLGKEERNIKSKIPNHFKRTTIFKSSWRIIMKLNANNS
jgi:hypothetical protein